MLEDRLCIVFYWCLLRVGREKFLFWFTFTIIIIMQMIGNHIKVIFTVVTRRYTHLGIRSIAAA